MRAGAYINLKLSGSGSCTSNELVEIKAFLRIVYDCVHAAVHCNVASEETSRGSLPDLVTSGIFGSTTRASENEYTEKPQFTRIKTDTWKGKERKMTHDLIYFKGLKNVFVFRPLNLINCRTTSYNYNREYCKLVLISLQNTFCPVRFNGEHL